MKVVMMRQTSSQPLSYLNYIIDDYNPITDPSWTRSLPLIYDSMIRAPDNPVFPGLRHVLLFLFLDATSRVRLLLCVTSLSRISFSYLWKFDSTYY